MVQTDQSGSWPVVIWVCNSLIRCAEGLLNEGVAVPKSRIYIRQHNTQKESSHNA